MIANRLVLLTALAATIVVGGTRAAQAENTAPQSQRGLSDQDVQSAADQLLVLVNPSRRENSYFPPFARQEIEWMNAQAKANVLSIILLKDLANTNPSAQDLMGAGIIGGKRAIIIAQPRFTRLLIEATTIRAPFSLRARNDFMLALVHEVVHLQNPKAGDPASGKDSVKEELRAWSEVDRKVVRTLRLLGEPMNPQFIRVDDALRSCGDHPECPLVRQIIFSGVSPPY